MREPLPLFTCPWTCSSNRWRDTKTIKILIWKQKQQQKTVCVVCVLRENKVQLDWMRLKGEFFALRGRPPMHCDCDHLRILPCLNAAQKWGKRQLNMLLLRIVSAAIVYWSVPGLTKSSLWCTPRRVYQIDALSIEFHAQSFVSQI